MASHGTLVASHARVATIRHLPPAPSGAAPGISPTSLPLSQAGDTSSSSHFGGRQADEGRGGPPRSQIGCGYVWDRCSVGCWHLGSLRVVTVPRSQTSLFRACRLWHHTGSLPAPCQPRTVASLQRTTSIPAGSCHPRACDHMSVGQVGLSPAFCFLDCSWGHGAAWPPALWVAPSYLGR